MSKDHEHSHCHFIDTNKIPLLIAFLINVFVMVGELIAGYFSGSLSLMSDGLHMGTHVFALGCAYWACGKPKTETKVALMNGILLVAMSFFLLYYAFQRWYAPVEILSKLMIGVACIGLLANLLQIYILRPVDKKNINIKGVFRHVLSDTVLSFVVILGGVTIYFTSFHRIDTVLAFLFFPFILWGGVDLIKEAVRNLNS